MKKKIIAAVIIFGVLCLGYIYKDRAYDIINKLPFVNNNADKHVEENELLKEKEEELTFTPEQLETVFNAKDISEFIKTAQKEQAETIADLQEVMKQTEAEKIASQDEIIVESKRKGPKKQDIKKDGNQIKIDKNKMKITPFAVETADVWTPTFQLCWNEAMLLIGREKIEYINGNPKLADKLNLRKFNKYNIRDNSYYISVTKQTLKHKKEIERAIWNKFKEKSDILKKFNFPNIPDEDTNEYFIYSMMLKNFKFVVPFDELESDYFNNNQGVKYKYFGINEKSSNKDKLREKIDFLFYANEDDYAVKIKDKTGKEEMFLYLTDSDDSFDNIYAELNEKSKYKNEYTNQRIETIRKEHAQKGIVDISFKEYLKIPFIKIDETLNFDEELANKPIKGRNYEKDPNNIWIINKTIQTIKFDMDNIGAKLKSEAAISMREGSMYNSLPTIIIDKYYFDKPFVMFIKETGKDKPYFAARIKSGKYLVKT